MRCKRRIEEGQELITEGHNLHGEGKRLGVQWCSDENQEKNRVYRCVCTIHLLAYRPRTRIPVLFPLTRPSIPSEIWMEGRVFLNLHTI